MEDGKAVGVKVRSENGEYTIRAKAIILASGGFGADLDRVAALKPALAGFGTTNVSTVTGDGIECALSEKGGTAAFSYLLDADDPISIINRNTLEISVQKPN